MKKPLLSLAGLPAVFWSVVALQCLGADPGLTPESLAMPRYQIALTDAMLRLFNGRGAISVRDKTVTGLQSLNFPPAATTGYRFGLAFREAGSGVLIRDIADDVHENHLRKGGLNPLGMNQGKGPLVVLLQDAIWRPNQFLRTGTFHKRLQGRWISFGLTTKASVSAEADEVYLELEVENRQEQALDLTVCPEQRKGEPGDAAECIAYTLRASTLRFGKFQTTVVSDLGDPRDGGWPMRIPGRQKHTARFAIVAQPAGEQTPSLRAGDLAARIARADEAIRRRLRWASDRLPRVTTENRRFDEFYQRCVLSVLECRWERKNFALHPFYSIGDPCIGFTLAWDTSYASEMLAILDPEGLRSAILAHVRFGLLKVTWIRWDGVSWDGVSQRWYAQTPFAAMRILLDYLTQTGDASLLDHSESGVTVFASLKKAGQEIHAQFARPDGLLDFGEGSGKMLEVRTDGYEHVVAASNGLAVDYFRQLAEWCRRRNDPDAAQFEQWAAQIHKAMNEQLWNEKAGWFENLYPDGTHHVFLSYHQFDLLDGHVLSPAQRRGMTGKIKEGQFLGPYGMYSTSRLDRTHWDLEDADWGGGGQYPGMPLRIAEALYRGGQSDLGWDILSRCLRWVEKYPYFPGEIFTDSGGYVEVDTGLEICAGTGVNTILFGVFGLRPKADGSLEIAPAYHPSLGRASMKGYRFRGHVYDVLMDPARFQVFRDGELVADQAHGSRLLQSALSPPRRQQ